MFKLEYKDLSNIFFEKNSSKKIIRGDIFSTTLKKWFLIQVETQLKSEL